MKEPELKHLLFFRDSEMWGVRVQQGGPLKSQDSAGKVAQWVGTTFTLQAQGPDLMPNFPLKTGVGTESRHRKQMCKREDQSSGPQCPCEAVWVWQSAIITGL